jgi:long-chain acyl-CoA synthetase
MDKRHAEFLNATVVRTLPGLFAARVQRNPDKTAYQQYDPVAERWCRYSWKTMQQLVSRWHQALLRERLDAGERVAIMLNNRIEWVCFDQAAQSLGLVTVSLYTTDTAANIAYILADAGVRLLFVGDLSQWRILATHCADLPALRRVWCLTRDELSDLPQGQLVRFVEDMLPDAASDYVIKETNATALATIIYTSGTTGRPKGVMLSHHNLLANAEAVQQQIPAYPDDVFLSFLPLAHGFERTVEYIFPMMAGSQVTYARSIKQLPEDLLVVRPTVFLSAPRLYEKIYAAIQLQLAENKLKQKLFSLTIGLGWKRFLAVQQRGPALNFIQAILWRLLYLVVSKKVLAKLGGRLRIVVTGAAPLLCESWIPFV